MLSDFSNQILRNVFYSNLLKVTKAAFSYLTKAWILSSTSSKSSSPGSSSQLSSLYLGPVFDALSLCIRLCPCHALLASLLENRQLLVESDGAADRASSLERSERSRRGRAILRQSMCSFSHRVQFTQCDTVTSLLK